MAAYADSAPDRFTRDYRSGPYPRTARPVESFVPIGVPLDAPARPVRVPYALPAGIRRRTRDVGGSVLLLVAAAVGIFAWFGPWSSIVTSVTGRTVFLAMRNFRDQSRWALAIQVVLIASIAVGVLGLGLLVKSYTRRYLGYVALLAALVTIVAELYFLIQAGFDLENTWLGYWAFLAVGFLMLVGAVKALGAPR